jgi:predicted permease
MSHTLLLDLRSALRHVVRDWRFSTTLALTLATGIAATAIVFHVINNTLLRPLPIPDEARVYRLLDWTRGPDGSQVRRSTRVHNLLAIQATATSFDAVVGLRAINVALDAGGDPVQAYIGLVSPGSFGLLGVRPVVGRLFSANEEDAGADAGVVVLSHALWQQEFGGRADVVDLWIRLDGRPHRVIGVLGPGFRFPYLVDAWIPERVALGLEASLATLAHLAPTVPPAEAQRELERIAAAVERERPDTNRGLGFVMVPLRDHLIGSEGRAPWALMATAALLLGLAAVNVTNLLLSRGAHRAREMALRAAVGAPRASQVRQLIAESALYATAGTLVGLAVASVASRSVIALVPLPLREQLGLGEAAFDWRVAVFAASVMGATALAAGLAPARRFAGTDVVDALRHQARGSSGPGVLMQWLVVGEVALASMLLLAAGLMADNLTRLHDADLGLTPDGLSSIEITLPDARYADGRTRLAFTRQLTEMALALPGVEAGGFASVNPLDRGSFGAGIETEDHPLAPSESALIVNHRLVSEGWLTAAGVPLVRGRLFDARDHERSEPVAIVSRRMAARLWPGVHPVGRRIRQARPGMPWMTVVGVVGDVRDYGEWRDTWYLPYAQHASSFAAGTIHLMVRSPLAPDVLGRSLREAVRTVDAALPLPLPVPMTRFWGASLEAYQLAASASAIFGISGLFLAVMGTYSVLAYAVSARTREMGIRLALGAGRRVLLSTVVGRGAALAGGGLGLGVAAGVAVNRALQAFASESPGTSPDLVALVIVSLGGSALAASFVPAWRATRIDPSQVMRSE